MSSSGIGVGDLAARLVRHLMSTKKYNDRAKAVIRALEYYRIPRGKDNRFAPEIFSAVYTASKKMIHRGRPRGMKKVVEEEVVEAPLVHEVISTEPILALN